MGKPELTEELNRIEEVKIHLDDWLTKLSSLKGYDYNILNAYYSLESTGTSKDISYDSYGEIVEYYNYLIETEIGRYKMIEEKLKNARIEIDFRIEKLSEREREIREELDRIEAEEATLRKKGCLPVGVFKV